MTDPCRPISLCPPESLPEALAVLYRRVPGDLRDQLVASAMREAEAGRVDLSGLWAGRRRGRITGVLLTQTLAGRAAAVWAPEVEPIWGRGALAAGLIRAALRDMGDRGVAVAQALVDRDAPRVAALDLARGGLARTTVLTYMQRSTASAPRPRSGRSAAPPPPLEWRPFSASSECEFRRVLDLTYHGSLDMPELEGVRSLDDVMASHQAAGRFEPERWRLGTVPGEPDAAAVVLLSEVIDRNAWEVAYLGLTPAARGRGLGRAVLAHALELARPAATRLELAVDDRNRPARRLYDAAGFTPFDRRAVHLAVLRRGASTPPGPSGG